MRVYLDNCCFNRPYDDQEQLRIHIESQAKIYIQYLIKTKSIELASSFVLRFENSNNPYDIRKNAINQFIESNSFVFIDETLSDYVTQKAKIIMQAGIKFYDACHVACAILSKCDFFLTTDKRLLKFMTDEIQMANPVDFITFWEERQ